MKWLLVGILALVVEVAQTLAILFVLRRRPLASEVRLSAVERGVNDVEGALFEVRARVEVTERRLVHIEDDIGQQRKELETIGIELRNVAAEVTAAHRVILDESRSLRAAMMVLQQGQAQNTARLLDAIQGAVHGA